MFIRLSPYREKLRKHLAETWSREPTDRECDQLLESTATLVLGAAWYEDQAIPFHVSRVFSLTTFKSALEQVAWVLGSDLYQVATALQDDGKAIVAFFDHVYDNRNLARLIECLACHGVQDLSHLEKAAREAFLQLNTAFSTFMSTTNAIQDLERLELYKIILGNFGRLDEVAGPAYWTPALIQASRAIEDCAASCIDRLHSALDQNRKVKLAR
jgi:hypothetical protein